MTLLNRQRISVLLGLTIALQLGVSTAVLSKAWYTRANGEEILLRSVPVDPRSLFRGNYARISYDISNIELSAFAAALSRTDGGEPDKTADPDTAFIPRGTKVYTVLGAVEDNIYEFQRVELSTQSLKPTERYIQGRLIYKCYIDQKLSQADCRVKYGIEAYFAPEKQALDLEERLRTGSLASIRLTDSGQAALLAVLASPTAAQ